MHKVVFVNDNDVRGNLGTQKMMKTVPYELVYVADFKIKTGISTSNDAQKMFVVGTKAGSMFQNDYLYCTALKLNTVVLALVSIDELRQLLN